MHSAEVVVIGAGQAGLASAQQLKRRGVSTIVLDANRGPGGAWRHRWDSLTLGKAHGIANLPGLAAPAGDDSTPASHVVANYYGTYEDHFGLDVRRPVRVENVHYDATAHLFHLATTAGSFQAPVLINATGAWDSPFIPHVPGAATFRGRQLHTKDYTRAADFAGQRTLVVGGGLSAVQFLLELEGVADTIWATRRPPDFVSTAFDARWGRAVEDSVRARTQDGKRPASVVSTTGIPPWQDYLDAVKRGLLVSRGMFSAIDATGVIFSAPRGSATGGPEVHNADAETRAKAWRPFPAGTHIEVDTIFWNTGFRPHLGHLAGLRLRSARGGIEMLDEVTPAANPRALLAGYGSTASTVGATRAGRLAAKRAAEILGGA